MSNFKMANKIKKTLKNLKIKNKIDIINKINNGTRKISIAREYGILPSTITCIYKNKETICTNSLLLNNYNMKRTRKCPNEKLNQAFRFLCKRWMAE